MEMTYDREAKAIYIKVNKKLKFSKTNEINDVPLVLVDVDKNDKVIGIEVLLNDELKIKDITRKGYEPDKNSSRRNHRNR